MLLIEKFLEWSRNNLSVCFSEAAFVFVCDESRFASELSLAGSYYFKQNIVFNLLLTKDRVNLENVFIFYWKVNQIWLIKANK